SLLPPAERAQIVREFAPPAREYGSARTLHALFEAQAAATPDATAATSGSEHVSYGALDARASALARRVVAATQGVDEPRVALCVERSLDMGAGILGALKAGAAYVPLDPAYPADRLQYVLADSGAAVLLAPRAQAASLDLPPGCTLLALEDLSHDDGSQ